MSRNQHSVSESGENQAPDSPCRMVLTVPNQLRWKLKARAANKQTTLQRLIVQILETDVAKTEAA